MLDLFDRTLGLRTEQPAVVIAQRVIIIAGHMKDSNEVRAIANRVRPTLAR